SCSLSSSTAPPDLHSFPTRRSSDLVLLVPQVQAPVELVQLGGMQHILVHHARCCVDDATAQVLLISTIILVVAQRLSPDTGLARSEEHTSELQSRENLVCRLLLEKK